MLLPVPLIDTILWVDKQRVAHPKTFRLLFGIAIALCNPWILKHFGVADALQPSFLQCSASTWGIVKTTTIGIAGVFEGLILSEMFFLCLPLILYVPQTIAMKTLGLLFITLNHKELSRLTRVFAAQCRTRERIRIACISGKHLFRETEAPLHKEAVKGNLEVIMPGSSEDNKTVKTRYSTYPEEYRKAEGIPDLDSYIKEIESSKEFLLKYNNIVYEHNLFLPLRLLLIDTRCIIQNYLPNSSGQQSHKAPAFIYHDVEGKAGFDSIYDSYSNYYEVVKNCSKKINEKS